MEPAVIFTSARCASCSEVKNRIEGGQIDGVPVELVDVGTDDGFARFMQEIERSGADTLSIPSAFHEGKQCELRFIGKRLSMEC